MKEVKQLKPVIFEKGEYSFHRQNEFQQNLLLQALKVTTDPKKLKAMTGLKTIAEVYRTLDKLAIRKEYHEALTRQGIDLDTIVQGIQGICNDFFTKSDTRLKAYQTLLRSLGLEKYEEAPEASKKSWEDTLNEYFDKQNKQIVQPKYDVEIPEIPPEEQKRIEEERKMGEGLYE